MPGVFTGPSTRTVSSGTPAAYVMLTFGNATAYGVSPRLALSRTLLRISVEDAAIADEIFSTLMGDNVESRKNELAGDPQQNNEHWEFRDQHGLPILPFLGLELIPDA